MTLARLSLGDEAVHAADWAVMVWCPRHLHEQLPFFAHTKKGKMSKFVTLPLKPNGNTHHSLVGLMSACWLHHVTPISNECVAAQPVAFFFFAWEEKEFELTFPTKLTFELTFELSWVHLSNKAPFFPFFLPLPNPHWPCQSDCCVTKPILFEQAEWSEWLPSRRPGWLGAAATGSSPTFSTFFSLSVNVNILPLHAKQNSKQLFWKN